ncbi:hypothetical protein FGE12_02975 [Aggregicoccus sp. 17bor-14]|uniref:hypothetical protein n=1 Tax=Myxococcaceae TaxID=31 RepID=UPI00129C1536|nr:MULTISPECIES: hypothetical protein [Myxococcaceae]MBF5041334.1 hypothetical protein [Simulacricoccus sp. 17bor-14]MRI87120.1 hypothetical protein [Aggregicoccus sp. 17bor-14]
MPLAQLDSHLQLSAFVPLGFSRASSLGAFNSESRVVGLDLIPSVRLGLRGPAALGFYADAGAGVTHLRYRFSLPGMGTASGARTGLALRLAAGATWTLGPRCQLFAEPLGLTFHTAQEGVFRFGNTQFTSSTGAGPQASVLLGGTFTL